MEIRDMTDNLKRVIVTLDSVKTDNRDGGWDKLLGCRQMLVNCVGELQHMQQPEEDSDDQT